MPVNFKKNPILGEEPEPEFKEKIIEGFKQCYQISRKVPQSIIDSHGPMGKQFGRQKIFYKCTMVCNC